MKKIFNEWKYIILGIFLILTLAFSIRVFNLNILPIFADEAIYIRWSQVMKAESTLRFLPLSDGKQPLYVWILIPFLKFISDPLFAGRFVSVVTGMGTIIGVFVATLVLFKSKKASLISAFIYSIVPFAIFFDRMALADSMLTMFGIWIFTFGVLLVKNLRLDIAMILGFILGAALLTKSPALYFSLLLPVLVFFVEKKQNILKYLILLVPTYLIGYGIFNILRLGPNFHMLALRNLDYVYPVSHIISSPLDPFKPFLDRSKEFYWIMGTGSLFVMWVLSYVTNFKYRFKEILVLTAWFIGPILVSSEFSKTMTARYVLFSLPYFVIISSMLFLKTKSIVNKLATLLLIIFVYQALNFDYKILTNPYNADLPRGERSGYLEEWTAGQGISEISLFLKEQSANNPSQKIVVGTEGFFGTLPDGLQIYFNGQTNVNVIGVGLQLETVPNQLIESKKFGNTTYLVVNNERLHMDYQKESLKLIKEYPKAVRPDGSKQSLMLFEVTNETLSKK